METRKQAISRFIEAGKQMLPCSCSYAFTLNEVRYIYNESIK